MKNKKWDFDRFKSELIKYWSICISDNFLKSFYNDYMKSDVAGNKYIRDLKLR